MRFSLLAPLLLAAALSLPSSVSAQVLFRAPVVGQGDALVSASAHDTVADHAPAGGTIAAVHFDSDVVIGGLRVRSLGAGRSVALASMDASGRVRWIRRFAEEAGPGRPSWRVISRVVALADGGAVFGGSYGDGDASLGQGALARVDARGRTLWELHPRVTSDYSRFVPAPSGRGTVVVLGNFFRGDFQLPGGEAWTSRQRFTSFLAEIDLRDGSVRWARRVPGEGRQIEIATDGTIYVAGQFQRHLRVGSTTLRGVGDRDVFVAHFDAEGAPLGAVAYGTPAEDHPRGVSLSPGGALSLLVSSRVSGADRFTLLGFDERGERTLAQPLGPRAVLVRSDRPGPTLLALPGPVRRVRLRGTSYDVVDHIELVRFSAQGGRVSRTAVRFPGVGLLVRSLHARSAGGQVVLSGALSAGAGSESFHVWLTPPAPPRAVAARYGAVL